MTHSPCVLSVDSQDQTIDFGQLETLQVDSVQTGQTIKTMPLDFNFTCPSGIDKIDLTFTSSFGAPSTHLF